MEEFVKQNIQPIIGIITALLTIIGGSLAVQRWFHVQKCDRLADQHQAEITALKNQHDTENFNKEKQLSEARQKLEHEFEDKNQKYLTETQKPLIQEVKLVYVRYLHIKSETAEPAYRKFITRLGETIDVRSEYQYYRFNKFSNSNNSITLIDRSTGIVEPRIMFPWRKLAFTDVPSKKSRGMLTQDIGDSDTYFSVTSYYNGFKEGDEDVGMKMEMDTQVARMIADFSSIEWLSLIFTKEPDAYKIELNGERTKLLGLEEIDDGIYHLEVSNMKKGESLLIDFHVNWDYFTDSAVPKKTKHKK